MFFASPGARQTCPTVAACWSPSAPVIGSWPANGPRGDVIPYGSGVDDGRIRGSIRGGTVKKSHSSSSQSSVWRFISMVRLALVTSVT